MRKSNLLEIVTITDRLLIFAISFFAKNIFLNEVWTDNYLTFIKLIV
jgi:hypothetical protein